MAKSTTAGKKLKGHICSFCLDRFDEDKIWWVDLLMHRNDPNCNTYYSIPTCGPCKDNPENSWIIVKISREPKPPKVKKSKK